MQRAVGVATLANQKHHIRHQQHAEQQALGTTDAAIEGQHEQEQRGTDHDRYLLANELLGNEQGRDHR